MYSKFYQLREEPFRLTSDPRFFHLAKTHWAALTTLVQAVVRRRAFVVLTGPIGTGKTTILHRVLQILSEKSMGERPIASAFLLNPMLTREEFLEMILAEFEIPCTSTSKPARLTALRRMLLDTQRRGGTSVLLVDEAHLLSVELLEEIRLLSDADTYQEKLLQIVLSGQPELLTILHRPELRALQQRIVSTCMLQPLSLPELRIYVAERLHAAGLRGPNPFLGPALESVYRYSEGVPRLINLVCDACLTIGEKTKRPLIHPDVVDEAAAEHGLADSPTAKPERILPPQHTLEDAVSTSAVDIVIHGMRQARASARE